MILLRAIKLWLNHPTPPWKFWDPRSGMFGGFIMGGVLFAVVRILAGLVSHE